MHFGVLSARTFIVQVIEWGNLATVVLLDTRVSERSAEPTGGSNFGSFLPAYANANMSAYEVEPLVSVFAAIHEGIMAEINNPNYTMIGSKTDFLQEQLEASKAAGKPWQIFGSATMMGPFVPPDLQLVPQFAPNDEAAALVQQVVDAVLGAENGGLFREAAVMASFGTPWNMDDYNGFGHERAKILDIFRDSANNGIILGGDLHDNWAWQMYESGAFNNADPVAINLGAPGVASPGWGPVVKPLFDSISDLIGGEDVVYDMLNSAIEEGNPGMVYGDIGKKGFFVVTADKQEANIEYYGMRPEAILMDYESARAESGSITALYECGAHLVSTAGEPGSLVEVDGCSALFDSERPAVWDIPMPASDSPDFTISTCKIETCTLDVSDLGMTSGQPPGDSGVSRLSLACLFVVVVTASVVSTLL